MTERGVPSCSDRGAARGIGAFGAFGALVLRAQFEQPPRELFQDPCHLMREIQAAWGKGAAGSRLKKHAAIRN